MRNDPPSSHILLLALGGGSILNCICDLIHELLLLYRALSESHSEAVLDTPPLLLMVFDAYVCRCWFDIVLLRQQLVGLLLLQSRD